MSSDSPTPTHLNPPPPPPTTTSSSSLTPHHHHHLLLPPPHPPTPTSPSSSSTLAPREYRKGNWTLHETLVLINAKRLDDERRSSSRSQTPPSSLDVKPNINNVISSPSSSPQRRSAELRWKWVENYCWRNECLRSQNQCNDKWDNLLRDYKKVRDYEARCQQNKDADGGSCVSYWAMEKHDRKERNLPSNLVTEVFEALTDVLSRRNAHKGQINANAIVAAAAASRPLVLPTITMTAPPPPPPPLPPLQPQPINHLQVQQHQMATVPVPPAPAAAKQQQPEPSVPETSGSSETERSTESGRKRRKKGAAARDLGSSVVKAASVLARSLMECEEKREKRHRELMELEERRLRMENERTEISRHGISGLIAAVNSLSGAIHTLVSEHHQHHDDDNR